MTDYESNARLIVRVIRDVLRTEAFASIADLKVAVKHKLRDLKIPYEPADLDAAFTIVASNRPLVED